MGFDDRRMPHPGEPQRYLTGCARCSVAFFSYIVMTMLNVGQAKLQTDRVTSRLLEPDEAVEALPFTTT